MAYFSYLLTKQLTMIFLLLNISVYGYLMLVWWDLMYCYSIVGSCRLGLFIIWGVRADRSLLGLCTGFIGLCGDGSWSGRGRRGRLFLGGRWSSCKLIHGRICITLLGFTLLYIINGIINYLHNVIFHIII